MCNLLARLVRSVQPNRKINGLFPHHFEQELGADPGCVVARGHWSPPGIAGGWSGSCGGRMGGSGGAKDLVPVHRWVLRHRDVRAGECR